LIHLEYCQNLWFWMGSLFRQWNA